MLPKGLSSKISEGLMSKGLAAAPMSDDSGDDMSDDVDVSLEDVAGDIFDALKSGSKEDFVKFLLELLDRKSSPEDDGDEE